MKDSEFIELLNLYVDHEIGAEDARRLESEVNANPERRRLYRQYCMIHKACSLLADDCAAAPEERPAAVRDETPARVAWGWATGAGLMAAAAVAMLVYVRVHTSERAIASAVHAPVAEAVAVARPDSAASAQNPLKGLTPVLPLSELTRQSLGLAQTGPNQAISWVNTVNLPPMAESGHQALPAVTPLQLSPMLFSPAIPTARTDNDSDSVIGFEIHF